MDRVLSRSPPYGFWPLVNASPLVWLGAAACSHAIRFSLHRPLRYLDGSRERHFDDAKLGPPHLPPHRYAYLPASL